MIFIICPCVCCSASFTRDHLSVQNRISHVEKLRVRLLRSEWQFWRFLAPLKSKKMVTALSADSFFCNCDSSNRMAKCFSKGLLRRLSSEGCCLPLFSCWSVPFLVSAAVQEFRPFTSSTVMSLSGLTRRWRCSIGDAAAIPPASVIASFARCPSGSAVRDDATVQSSTVFFWVWSLVFGRVTCYVDFCEWARRYDR